MNETQLRTGQQHQQPLPFTPITPRAAHQAAKYGPNTFEQSQTVAMQKEAVCNEAIRKLAAEVPDLPEHQFLFAILAQAIRDLALNPLKKISSTSAGTAFAVDMEAGRYDCLEVKAYRMRSALRKPQAVLPSAVAIRKDS